jgi:uncharacterized membrane protein
LFLLGGSSLMIGLAMALAGAWLVLPFAGLEVILLVWAFGRIGKGDHDFERITLADGVWNYEARHEGVSLSGRGALAWLGIEQVRERGQLQVRLRYAGKRLSVGRFLSEEERAGLARELNGLIREAR